MDCNHFEQLVLISAPNQLLSYVFRSHLCIATLCPASFPPVLIYGPRGNENDMVYALHNDFSSLSVPLVCCSPSSVFTSLPIGIHTGHCV